MNSIALHLPAGRPAIVVAEGDARRLAFLLSGRGATSHDAAHLSELRAELERAVIVAPGEIPADVVAMNSIVGIVDLQSDDLREVKLVYPHDAQPSQGRISVLAPLGTALLGYRVGDHVEWLMPGGLRRLRIESVRISHEPVVSH
jgi:regulator of nucleoside diphosphate kinase